MSIDARCIQFAGEGDRDAQRIIYESLADPVHRVVLRIVGPSDADDVTQNVFLNLFTKLALFRYESELATWVYRLAVNEALQHLRRVRRQATVQLSEGENVQIQGGGATDNKELVETALSRIEAELRLILELKEFENMSYAQIAEVIGIPEGTVGSRLNRARGELRHHLLALGWEGN